MAKGAGDGGTPRFSERELRMIRNVKDLYGYDYCANDWRNLLDQWHWWASNWRKHRGYFLGEVGVLSFEVFLARQDIAERGYPIYERTRRRICGATRKKDR